MGTTPKQHYPHRRSPFQELQLNPHSVRRGPMYSAYAELREWRLRNKYSPTSHILPPPTPTRTSSITTPSKREKNTPIVSRSVQDFSTAFRKENNKPPSSLSSASKIEGFRKTPTPSLVRGREGMRKSYACLKELKEYSMVASSAISEERKGVTRKSSVGIVGRQRQGPLWMG